MEAYLPRFFAGSVKILKQLDQFLGRGTQFRQNSFPLNGGHSKSVSARAVEILRRNMSLEYEFYDFAAQRLLLQKRRIQIEKELKTNGNDIFHIKPT